MNNFSNKIKSQPTDTPMTPLKRTRAKRSCDFCRKRKARCDADHTIPCSNCKAWGFTCEFLTVRKKRGPPSVYVENLENRCKKMESLLTSLTKTSIKDIERNDFNIDLYSKSLEHPHRHYKDDDDEDDDEEEYDHDEDDDEDDDDDDEDDDEQDNAMLNHPTTTTKSKKKQHDMEETLANLDLNDYDSIKYTGHSAGFQLFDTSLFKSKTYLSCPGRGDVALKLMSQNELLVVRAPGKKKVDTNTRLDVGFSLNSSIFDEKDPMQHCLYTPNTAQLLPSAKLIERAYELYFSHIHTFLPVVNRTRFETHGVRNPANNVLSQAVLAVSFRFASRHFPKLFNSKKAALYAETYYRKVMQRLQDVYRARLRHVQAALLMTLYLDMDETADIESIQWYTLGKAIRMAQDIGLHRSCSNWNLPPSEIETRHRVFYACYVLDRWMGARAGKPLTILDRDFDTDMPVAHEVYDDNNTTAMEKTSVYHSFISLIKLSEILGRVLKALYAPNCKPSNNNAGLDDPTILAVFDRRLKNWKSNLDQSETGVNWSQAQKVNLLLFYYTVMLLLHRPFLEFSSSTTEKSYIQGSVDLDQLAAESRQACENAAANISVVVRQKQSLMNDPDSYGPLCLPTCLVYAMFQSSLIHLAIATKNRDSLRRLRLLQRSIALMKQHGQLASAQRAHNILSMLVKINGINIKNLLENDTKEEDSIQLISDDSLLTQTQPSVSEPQRATNELRFTENRPESFEQTTSSNNIMPGCENAMPKSSWYQRMMNTSIVGGITADLHQGIQQQQQQQQQEPPRIHNALEQLLPLSELNDRGPTIYPQEAHYQTSSNSSNSSHFQTPRISHMNRKLDLFHGATPSFSEQPNSNNILNSMDGPTLLSHHHIPPTRTGLTPTPFYPPQTTCPPSFPGILDGHPLNSSPVTSFSSYTTATSASLPPSNLNWNDWTVYLSQHHESNTTEPSNINC